MEIFKCKKEINDTKNEYRNRNCFSIIFENDDQRKIVVYRSYYKVVNKLRELNEFEIAGDFLIELSKLLFGNNEFTYNFFIWKGDVISDAIDNYLKCENLNSYLRLKIFRTLIKNGPYIHKNNYIKINNFILKDDILYLISKNCFQKCSYFISKTNSNIINILNDSISNYKNCKNKEKEIKLIETLLNFGVIPTIKFDSKIN